MKTVSGAEFSKNFGRYRMAAHKEPVFVTSYGKEDLVLMDVSEYQRLKARDRQALFAWELNSNDIAALQKDDIPTTSKEYDHELE